MKKNKKIDKENIVPMESVSIDSYWEESMTYISTVVDILKEPILILDKELRVLAINNSFCKTFQVASKDTMGKVIYELGNGQWDIPSLRKLLEDILPKNTFFTGFEVEHNFPIIGHKVMILNARRIYKEGKTSGVFPPIILLAIEDITEMVTVAKRLADHTTKFQDDMSDKTQKMEMSIEQLIKEISELKKKS